VKKLTFKCTIFTKIFTKLSDIFKVIRNFKDIKKIQECEDEFRMK